MSSASVSRKARALYKGVDAAAMELVRIERWQSGSVQQPRMCVAGPRT